MLADSPALAGSAEPRGGCCKAVVRYHPKEHSLQQRRDRRCHNETEGTREKTGGLGKVKARPAHKRYDSDDVKGGCDTRCDQ